MMIGMRDTENSKKKREVGGRGLIDLVFSWSIRDVLDKYHYKNQVTKIPDTFSTVTSYMKSFVPSLLEETHEDLFSSMKSLSRAPACQILRIEPSKDHKPPKDLFYQLTCMPIQGEDKEKAYEPDGGDIIALADVRPKYSDDLNRPRNSYLLAYVLGSQGSSNEVLILASKVINGGEESVRKKITSKRDELFAVYLMNITTNIRVWKALTSDFSSHTNLLKIVLQVQPSTLSHGQNSCTICFSRENSCPELSTNWHAMCSELNDSQKAAVLNCVSLAKCDHQNTVRLIWGPPGTGKTKAVGLSLFALFQLKCRTLTCTPTNISILEVTRRLLSLVNQSLPYGKYGLGDIVLFGNRRRLKIDDYDDLLEVFLDDRIEILSECLAPFSGWNHWQQSMIELLEDPDDKYSLYLIESWRKYNADGKNGDKKDSSSEDHNKCLTFEEFVKMKARERCDNNVKQSDSTNSSGDDHIDVLTFEEFVKMKHNSIGEKLMRCIVNLYTHLPTCCISFEVVKDMVRAIELLKSIKSLVTQGIGIASENFQLVVNNCVLLLRSIGHEFSVPTFIDGQTLRNFCLENACLVFCTASSSARLYMEGIKPYDLLVIDEAAQLKECESAIPLQLPGLRHTILIGDEKQLPSMVKSKIADNAGFGRSLFERLVLLGHEKHLLNVQYRMHPSISSFPKKEFYSNQISDGANVKERSYEKCFLQGKMFGSYSFINIADGKEELDRGHSWKNMVEVAVVYQIVRSLYEEFTRTKKKVSIGIISPYTAQVNAIKKRITDYSIDQLAGSGFSVSVRSVDGFQGGEEDVIIISTVRCNENGSIGFLSNHQRANVVLTRARHCLWILGNGLTLSKSKSIWKMLITDAENRKCFYNADEDENLCQAIVSSLLDLNQVQVLFNSDSLLFRNEKWQVYFDNEFKNSIAKTRDNNIRREVVSLLRKLSSGWRQSDEAKLYGRASSELLKKYQVDKNLNLIWSVDILRENSQHVQMIQVWDMVPHSDIPKLRKRLDIIFESYTMDKINRCKQTSLEGDNVVPVRWPVECASSSDGDMRKSFSESDPLEFLSTPLSCLDMRD